VSEVRPRFLRLRSYCRTKQSLPFAKIYLPNLHVQDPHVFEEMEADTPLHSKGPHNWQTEVVSATVVCHSSSVLFCRSLRSSSTPAAHLFQVERNFNTSPAITTRLENQIKLQKSWDRMLNTVWNHDTTAVTGWLRLEHNKARLWRPQSPLERLRRTPRSDSDRRSCTTRSSRSARSRLR
jgi:hypothetical protein